MAVLLMLHFRKTSYILRIHRWIQLLSLRLCTIGCHCRISKIASTKLSNNIFVPFMFRSSFEPFKCLVFMIFLWSLYTGSFLCKNLSVDDWLLMPFLNFNSNSTLSAAITSVFLGWNITSTNASYYMFWVFPFCWLSIVFHASCFCTGKSFNVYYAIFDVTGDLTTF